MVRPHHLAAHHQALRAVALIDFESLPGMHRAYEQYRARLAADPEARANVAFVREARATVAERRSFLRKV